MKILFSICIGSNPAMSKWLCMATFVFLIIMGNEGYTQPLRQSKTAVQGLEVYGDYKDANQYYYAPGGLSLVKDKEGKPDFKLIQMRYTGTAATGNQGEIRFMNIVQFKVAMQHKENEDIHAARSALGRQATLSPLPIRNIEAWLVAPFEGRYKRIGQSGTFQSEGTSGNNTTTSYWTERTFTLRLENHEAQLLWDMVENGNIALSVAYSYYADMIGQIASDASIGGRNPSSSVDEQLDEITKVDSVTSLQLVRAEAFNVHVDIEKYPDLWIQKDLNEGIPPSYPALEVICFDFTDDLRPDLSMKTIEFEAIGVDGSMVQLRSEKFFGNNPDLHTRQIRFPYAVNMRKPFRYRVKEYSKEGEQTDTGWITRESWTGGLDITSRSDDIKFHRRTVELETDPVLLDELGIERLVVHIQYLYQNEPANDQITFTASGLPLVVTTVLCDKHSDITYRPEWFYTSGEGDTGLKNTLAIDNYAYIVPPEND